MGGSTSPSVPPPSKQENDMLTQQTALLKQQQMLTQKSFDTQNLLAPFLYEQLGLTPTMDAKGNITGFTQAPVDTTISDKQKAITGELLDRQQQALEGKLPVDPALTQSLDESEAQLHESLMRSLGPDYAASTPGISALNKFEMTKQSTLEGARRGDLTMAEQLALGMQAGQNQNSQFLMQGAGGVAGMGANYGQMFGQTAAGYSSPLSYLYNTRALQYDASKTAASNNAAMLGGIGSGVGSLAGMAIGSLLMPGIGTALGGLAGGAAGGAVKSSREFKEDLGPVDILENVKSLPIRRWKYKKEVGQGEDPHIGPYAEDFKARFGVGDGKVIHIADYLGVHLAATKRLAEKIDDLETAVFLKG